MSFFVRLTVLPLQGLEYIGTPYFQFLDDVPKTVARCFLPLNAKFDLFGSQNASLQIRLRIEIG